MATATLLKLFQPAGFLRINDSGDHIVPVQDLGVVGGASASDLPLVQVEDLAPDAGRAHVEGQGIMLPGGVPGLDLDQLNPAQALFAALPGKRTRPVVPQSGRRSPAVLPQDLRQRFQDAGIHGYFLNPSLALQGEQDPVQVRLVFLNGRRPDLQKTLRRGGRETLPQNSRFQLLVGKLPTGGAPFPAPGAVFFGPGTPPPESGLPDRSRIRV